MWKGERETILVMMICEEVGYKEEDARIAFLANDDNDNKEEGNN